MGLRLPASRVLRPKFSSFAAVNRVVKSTDLCSVSFDRIPYSRGLIVGFSEAPAAVNQQRQCVALANSINNILLMFLAWVYDDRLRL